jgi:hypothetical protein
MINIKMKKDFSYNGKTNEWVHSSLPISIDNELFNEMTDDEVASLINSRLEDINNEINILPKPQKPKKYLNDDELASGFAKAREKIHMPESFKDFFKKRVRLNQ